MKKLIRKDILLEKSKKKEVPGTKMNRGHPVSSRHKSDPSRDRPLASLLSAASLSVTIFLINGLQSVE